MIEKDCAPLTREGLLGYFLEACTPRDQWLLGMEFEKMGVDASAGHRIPYAGGNASVQSFLHHYLERRDGDPIYEGENLIGVDGTWGTISLEPGGQVEWSSRPCVTLARLAEELETHHRFLDDAGSALGIRWLDEAMDPFTPLSDVPWMPKARYKILGPYLGARGRLAHQMMTQTTSIQCAFDFESPEDWTRKFRAAALMAPVAVALFANSSMADGKETGYRSFRQAVWRETDPDRCGLPSVVFEPSFGIEAWLDWVLDAPSIFLLRARGLIPAGGVSFRRLMERSGRDTVTMEDWKLHLSAIFTEIRSYAYLEVRSADLQPAETVMAVPVFWAGLLYDDDVLSAALELGSGHDNFQAWNEAMETAARSGLEGSAGGRPLRELADRAVALVVNGLEKRPEFVGDPGKTLRPLCSLADRLGLHGAGGRG